MSNKNTKNLYTPNIHHKNNDFHIGYYLFCQTRRPFYDIFEESYHPQFHQVLSVLSRNDYFKLWIREQDQNSLLSNLNALKTVFYISVQECWAHLLFVFFTYNTLSDELMQNDTVFCTPLTNSPKLNKSDNNQQRFNIYDISLLRQKHKEYYSLEDEPPADITKPDFATKQTLESLVRGKPFRKFFWKEQVGIPVHLEKHLDSDFIVGLASDFLWFSWKKHYPKKKVTLRGLKKLILTLKTNLTLDIDSQDEFKRLRYFIENGYSNHRTDYNAIYDKRTLDFDNYLENIIKQILSKRELIDDDLKYIFSELKETWKRNKQNIKLKLSSMPEITIEKDELDKIIESFAACNNIDYVSSAIAGLLKEFLSTKDRKEYLDSPLSGSDDKINKIIYYNLFIKMKENSYIYKFLIELIIYLSSRYNGKFFIKTFEEKTKNLIRKQKSANMIESYQVLQQLYASTLGIYGLTKRKIKDFRSTRSKLSLDVDNIDKDAFNTLISVCENLYYGINNMKDKKELCNLLNCIAFATGENIRSSQMPLDIHINSKMMAAFSSQRVERLKSMNGNRKDDNFTVSTLFNRIANCYSNKSDSKHIEEARLSMILGIFLSKLLNMTNIELNEGNDASNSYIIEQLECLDVHLAKLFCLLNWDLKAIVDVLGSTIKQLETK